MLPEREVITSSKDIFFFLSSENWGEGQVKWFLSQDSFELKDKKCVYVRVHLPDVFLYVFRCKKNKADGDKLLPHLGKGHQQIM